jgi:hypothetical protein
MKSKKKWFIGAALRLVLGYAIWESFSQPGINDLKGDFEEVAFVRNEQNKGGIVRIYAVAVGNPAIAEYDACADLFPVNDFNSTTRIYFFDKNAPYPTTLSLEPPYYDTSKYEAINIIKRTGTN